MGLNLYKVRVYGGLICGPLVTVLAFFIVLSFYGFMWSLVGMFVGLLVGVVISKLLIRNAFSDMLEGNGVLALNIDSTGILRPFIVAVQSPYIRNKKMDVDDIFDRSAVMQLATPEHNRQPLGYLEDGGVRVVLEKKAMIKLKQLNKDGPVGVLELKKGEYTILKEKKGAVVLQLTPEAMKDLREKTKENLTLLELDENEYNKGRFALFHYPVLIYNDQTKSIITKDFLAEQEKAAFAEHGILYLNRKMQELTSVVRDFGRYVVELTKPQSGFFGKWWVWIIIVIFVGILIALFAGPIITAIKGAAGSATGAVQNVASNAGGAVTPR